MDFRDFNLKTKLIAAFLSLAALTAITGLTGIFFTWSVGSEGTQVGERHAPREVAATEIKLATTQAHLLFEEIVAGDESENIQEVRDLLDEAAWYATAILEGGVNDRGRIYPAESPQVRAIIKSVAEEIKEFKASAETRYGRYAGVQSAGSGADQAFDHAYSNIQKKLESMIEFNIDNMDPISHKILVNGGKAKFLLADGHLFLEENLAGDESESFEEIIAEFMEAKRLVGEMTIGNFVSTAQTISTEIDEFIALSRQRHDSRNNNTSAGSEADHQFDAAYEELITTADEAIRLINQDIAEALASATGYRNTSVLVSVATLIASFVFAAFLIFLFNRDVLGRISALSDEMQGLASGDMDIDISSAGDSDEIGAMAQSLQVFKLAVAEKGTLEQLRENERIEQAEKNDQIQRQIEAAVQAAAAGDFSGRVSLEDFDGILLDVGSGMNDVLELVDRGLSETVKVVSALADGDLTRRMQGEYKGAFAQLKQDANSMADQIESIAGRISSVTGAVRGATREIAAGINDLSARTEHQASSLEETTASMEELSTTVRQNADNAQEANQVSEVARNSADSGSAVADKAVTAMSGIEESSRQITDIVGLIQEIAFQTNLLALNASVEAARAGDAGRGFAVVANAVRALAQRAATASKDIKELITNSDNQVKAGVELVNQAGSSLGEIVSSVKKVADFVSDIAAASQEQSAGIDQVSNAITNMDEMTQQNASLVEETTAALTSAQTQLEDLRQAVGFFRTKKAMTADPREASDADMPTDNVVHDQQRKLARRVSGGGAAAALAVDEDWQEF
jgi:methyl-accepting chemotaxis protein